MTDETIQVRNTESGAMMDVLVFRKRAECIEVVQARRGIRGARVVLAAFGRIDLPDRLRGVAGTKAGEANQLRTVE